MRYTLIGDKKSKLRLVYYLHDLSLSQKISNVILYADDTVVKRRSSASKIDDDHNKALDNVNDLLIKYKLTLNKEKTKSMFFLKKNQENSVSRIIKNTELEEK